MYIIDECGENGHIYCIKVSHQYYGLRYSHPGASDVFPLFRISFETLTGNQLAKPKRGSQCPVLALAKQKDTSEAERQ